jgi:hypothetical protein
MLGKSYVNRWSRYWQHPRFAVRAATALAAPVDSLTPFNRRPPPARSQGLKKGCDGVVWILLGCAHPRSTGSGPPPHLPHLSLRFCGGSPRVRRPATDMAGAVDAIRCATSLPIAPAVYSCPGQQSSAHRGDFRRLTGEDPPSMALGARRRGTVPSPPNLNSFPLPRRSPTPPSPPVGRM